MLPSLNDTYWAGTPVGYSSTIVYGSARGAPVSNPETDAAYVAWLDKYHYPNLWPSNDGGVVTVEALDNSLRLIGLPVTGLIPPTKDQLTAYAADKRWRVETGGLTIGGTQVDTSRASQDMIANAHAYVVASGAVSVEFKATSGWVTMDAATVTAIALAVGAHVQACFAFEKTVDDQIEAGAITTTAEIDTAAWPTGG